MTEPGLFSSLRFRFALLLAVFSGLLMTIVMLMLEHNFRQSLYRENIDKGLGIARAIAFNAEDPLLTGDDLYLFSAVRNTRKAPGIRYARIVGRDGTIRAADDLSLVGNRPDTGFRGKLLTKTADYQVAKIDKMPEPLLELRVPIYSVADPPIYLGSIHLGLSEAPIQREILAMRYRLAGLALAALLLGSIAAYLLAGVSVRPVLALVEAVKQIGRGNLDQHIDIRRRDEIGILTSAFNEMAASLREKEFIKNTFERYMSKPLTDIILEHRDAIELGGEEKVVSVLFADIRRFTPLAEKLPPARILELLNAYFSTMIDVIAANGGMVDKLMGDSVMALFGAPVSLGDDPLRAVQCALDMQRAIVDFNIEQKRKGLPPLEVGIGINTGPVIAGNIGSSSRMEYTVIGDTVNVAARLQGLAGPGEILISEQTWRQVEQAVEAEAMPPIQLKGKEKPVSLYRVTGLRLVVESLDNATGWKDDSRPLPESRHNDRRQGADS
ncbi:adenylate cyclase [Geothermobacter ehrlichii]|uniref:Adenylate cyclase n=1 Tax=Geothermobacter ehrlichii TaxID=213224 RepID=A0A5D3WLD3_9BACT|nr:adenylate/guanylate cyclase domain-containing protein [Geothermobacter ehrlichii]TYO99912.1 adenylate cyclase [Geothermobacter ehrlichii]